MKTTSWLAEARDAVTQATSAADVQHQVDALRDSKDVLAEQLVEFRAFKTAAELGRSRWFGGLSPNPELLDNIKQAMTLRARALSTLTNRLGSYRQAIKNELIAGWHDYAARRMGNLLDLQDLASLLAEVDGLATLSRDLQEVLGKLGRLQNQLPTIGSLALLDQAESHLQKLEAALRPDAVRRFLSAVARGGAGLDLLNDDVVVWLQQHGARSSFRIVARAPRT